MPRGQSYNLIKLGVFMTLNKITLILSIVVGASNAGNTPDSEDLLEGQCVRINTGAPVPKGANAVVQVEDTELLKKSDDGKEELEIKIKEVPQAGQDIRPIGSDIAKESRPSRIL